MDIGTASIIFFSGIIAGPRASIKRALPEKIKKTLVSSIPLFVLGIGRAIVLKVINYQEHISEYGVHWNFFVTLSFLPLLILLHQALFSRIPYLIFSLTIMTGSFILND